MTVTQTIEAGCRHGSVQGRQAYKNYTSNPFVLNIVHAKEVSTLLFRVQHYSQLSHSIV